MRLHYNARPDPATWAWWLIRIRFVPFSVRRWPAQADAEIVEPRNLSGDAYEACRTVSKGTKFMRRHVAGAVPNAFLKARENAASES